MILSLGVFTPAVINATEIITVGSSLSSSQTFLGGAVVPYKEITVTAQMPGKITALMKYGFVKYLRLKADVPSMLSIA